mgnify:CR=1 FL=1
MNYIETLRDQLQDMGEGFVESLPSLAIAIFIVFLTWIVARFGARISDMIVGRTELRASLKTLIDTLVKLGVWLAGLFIAAIHDMGLATLTHTPSPMAFLRRLLGRPENERPFVMFPIGHPLPGLQVPDLRRKSLSEVFVEVDRRGDGSTVR